MMVSATDDPRKAGTIWARELGEPTLTLTPLLPASFRRVGEDNLPALAKAMGEAASAEILRRFQTGRRCYAAWVDGELAAYGWVSFEEEFVGELSLRLELAPGEAYLWDCATLPAYRQKRLFSALLVYILGELQAETLCRAWIGANRENLASQRGFARAGFTCLADLVIERVFAMRLAWVQGRPGVPERQVAEARRVFLQNRDRVWLAALTMAVQNHPASAK